MTCSFQYTAVVHFNYFVYCFTLNANLVLKTQISIFTCFLFSLTALLLTFKITYFAHFSCCCSVTKSCPTLCNGNMPGFPVLCLGVCSNSCPLSQWCQPTISSSVSLFFFLQSFPALMIFSNESVFCIRWPKYWSFSISPSNEYSRLISFRIDWFDFLAVQGTFKSFLQHHSSKALILWHSAFFIVQLHIHTWPLEKP